MRSGFVLFAFGLLIQIGLCQAEASDDLAWVTEKPVPLQISGGEPTIREDLPDIIAMAKNLGYQHIELVTNGISIAQDSALLPGLKQKGLTAVYLQFDGLREETYLKLRGRNMRSVRQKAITAARDATVCCTLAVPVVRGLNDT